MKKFISLFVLLIILSGCTQKKLTPNIPTLTPTDIPILTNPPITISADKNNEVKETISNEIKNYSLCGLEINNREDLITEKLGSPFLYSYDLFDSVAWIELKCYMQYEGITLTTSKRLRVSENNEESDYLLTEIDIYNQNYQTSKGIKVGDSLDNVIKEYNMDGFYSIHDDSTINNVICSMIKNRINHSGKYSDSKYDFNYGNIDKVAYVLYYEENSNLQYRPSLIFLFENNIVSHIILYDWSYEIV